MRQLLHQIKQQHLNIFGPWGLLLSGTSLVTSYVNYIEKAQEEASCTHLRHIRVSVFSALEELSLRVCGFTSALKVVPSPFSL